MYQARMFNQQIEESKKILDDLKEKNADLAQEHKRIRKIEQDRLESEDAFINSLMNFPEEILHDGLDEKQNQLISNLLNEAGLSNEKVNRFRTLCHELRSKFQSQELLKQIATPWEQCDPSLFYDKLKAELDNEHSIARTIGAPYEALISNLDQLNTKLKSLHGEYDDMDQEHATYSKIFEEVVENTVNLLFKKTINVDEYKAKGNMLATGCSPILIAIGLTMGLLVGAAVTLGILFPPIAVGVSVITAAAVGLPLFGFFIARMDRNNSFEKTQDELSKSMRGIAKSVATIGGSGEQEDRYQVYTTTNDSPSYNR